jgi:hypothetical protein
MSSAGRALIRSIARPNASRLVGSVQCASSKIINTGLERVSVSICKLSTSIIAVSLSLQSPDAPPFGLGHARVTKLLPMVLIAGALAAPAFAFDILATASPPVRILTTKSTTSSRSVSVGPTTSQISGRNLAVASSRHGMPRPKIG